MYELLVWKRRVQPAAACGNTFRGGGRSSWLGIQGAPLLVPFESVPLCMNSSSIDPFRLISSFPSCYSYSYSYSWVRPGRVRYVLHPVTRQCGGPQWEAGQYSAPSVRQHRQLAPAATARAGSARQRQAAAGSVASVGVPRLAWCGAHRVRVSGSIIYSFSEGRSMSFSEGRSM